MPPHQLKHTDHTPTPIKHPITILAEDLTTPENTGSLFRLCDALGIEKLHLTGNSITPPNKKIAKTSRSTEKVVDFVYDTSAESVIKQLKAEGYTIISLEITSDSVDLKNINYTEFDKICLVIGAESRGVSEALLNLSDYCIHIPMLGQNSSMNVVTATAIAVYELTRNRVN